MTPTETPRTDAACFSSRDPMELMVTSQQLERELAASKAEVERLKSLPHFHHESSCRKCGTINS